MKRSKYSEAQIAFVLKQAEDGTTIGEVFRKTGISEATFYAWRKKYAGLSDRSATNSWRSISPLPNSNSRCFTAPRPQTLPSISTLYGGSVKTMCAFSPAINRSRSASLRVAVRVKLGRGGAIVQANRRFSTDQRQHGGPCPARMPQDVRRHPGQNGALDSALSYA